MCLLVQGWYRLVMVIACWVVVLLCWWVAFGGCWCVLLWFSFVLLSILTLLRVGLGCCFDCLLLFVVAF